jgi:Protein of unknown function (DUF3108)
MKPIQKIYILFAIAMLLSAGLFAQTLKTVTSPPFRLGEKATYRVHYGLIDAGEATLEIKPDLKAIGGRNTFHIVGTGHTLGAFNMFYKVKDRYESFIDIEKLHPVLFIRRINEGGFITNQDYIFNHNKSLIKVKRSGTDKARNYDTVFTAKPGLQDILSAGFYTRAVDFAKYAIGDIITIETFFDEELWPLSFKYLGKETVNTKFGKMRCIKLKPVVQQGRVFDEKSKMTVWLSDDANHLPIRLQADVLVGSIKIDLKEYSGLVAPLAIVK